MRVYSRFRESFIAMSEEVLSRKLNAAQDSEVSVDYGAFLADQLHPEIDSRHRAEDQVEVRGAGRRVEAVERPAGGRIGAGGGQYQGRTELGRPVVSIGGVRAPGLGKLDP